MGYKLVEAAFAFVSAHNERARMNEQRELETIEVALLVLMGHRAVDDDPAPAFWIKRAEICSLLGIRDTEAGHKRVQRALGALVAAQAIAAPEKYQRGFTPRYRLIYQGGYQASTLATEVWTPSIPLDASKGDATRPGVWTPDDRSMDAQHPPEEEKKKEQKGDARATEFELVAPTPPDDPTPQALSPFCVDHPGGTTSPCFACGQARKAYTAANKPRPRRQVYDCDAGRHKVITPDGICCLCGARDVVDATELVGAPA